MKSELQELIEHLENEKTSLEKELHGCIEIRDYESAHYFSEGLDLVAQKLHILGELDHTNGLKIKNAREELSKVESQLLAEESEFIKRAWNRRLEYQKDRLKILESQPPRPYLDNQELDDLIYELLESRIKGFRLFLIKADNFYLDFTLLSSQILQVEFVKTIDLTQKERLSPQYTKQIKSLGFNYSQEADSWVFNYDFEQFKDTLKLMEVLSRLVFEVYFFRGLDKEMVVEVDG